MKSNEERINDLLSHLDSLTYIKPEEIPNIHLYMDQVTTFMEEHLSNTKRYPEDKVLTKTMINNYAKNNLLPAPIKKKYSKEHMLMLIFIYYYKNVLSFHDIQQIFKPITEGHFSAHEENRKADGEMGAGQSKGQHWDKSLEAVYREVFSMTESHMQLLKEDILDKFQRAKNTFTNAEEGDREYLQLFSFICQLSLDVYLKKQMIETIADQLYAEDETNGKGHRHGKDAG